MYQNPVTRSLHRYVSFVANREMRIAEIDVLHVQGVSYGLVERRLIEAVFSVFDEYPFDQMLRVIARSHVLHKETIEISSVSSYC